MDKQIFESGEKYLITTDSWFMAPDGRDYRAVWGVVQIVEDAALGVKTNRNSTNWYVMVGPPESSVILAGCQIHYAVKCHARPHTGSTICQTFGNGTLTEFDRHSAILIAE